METDRYSSECIFKIQTLRRKIRMYITVFMYKCIRVSDSHCIYVHLHVPLLFSRQFNIILI